MDDPTLYGPLYGLPYPPDPGPSFEGLASPEEIRRAIDTKRRLLEQQICALGALRNATLLINNFPNEIFVEILLMARLDDYDEVGLHYYQDGVPRTVGTFDWLPMMRVCRRWWAVARSTPRLWRSIDVYHSEKWLDLCISRSADATLELSFHDEDTALVAIPTLISVAPRIIRLLLPGIWDINFKRISPLLKLQMPNLVEIGLVRYFDYEEDDREAAPLELPPDHFPALTALHLDGVAMSWSSTQLSNLSFLEITDCIVKDGPLTLSAFLDVLKSCTRLEELRLVEFLSEALDEDAPIPNNIISLPKLRKLVIVIDAAESLPLLHCLNLPLDVQIFITPHTTWEIPDEEISFQRYIPPSNSHIAIFQSATYGDILVREDMMHLIARGPSMRHPHGISLDYEVRDHGPLDGLVLFSPIFGHALCEFSDMFINAPIDSLMLDGDTTHASQAQWSVLFSRLPKLESLTLSCTGESLANMFRALGAPPLPPPVVLNPSQSPLVCPKLRAVEITGDARCSDTDLVNIHHALQLRAINGAPALRKLWFRTKHETEAAFKARKALATQMFTEVMPDGGGRYDRASED